MFAPLLRGVAEVLAKWRQDGTSQALPHALRTKVSQSANVTRGPPPRPSSRILPRGPLRYLINNEEQIAGAEGELIEVGYNGLKPQRGRSVRYGNLYDQTQTESYGPYLKSTGTAIAYGERVVDPKGLGWNRLLKDQCDSAIAAGFDIIEWDNPDGYPLDAVLEAVSCAASCGLCVLAKNPLSMEQDPTAYLAHPAVVGVIVERGAGNPADMDALRRKAGKPDLPVWFVAFRRFREDGGVWARTTARLAASYPNMGVTYSLDGEYTSSIDLLVPSGVAAELRPAPGPEPKSVAQGDFASRIVQAMRNRGYDIAVGRDLLNIVYVEDMDTGGNVIPDVPNTFDSVRLLLRVAENAPPQIIGIWEATTQPGKYWTEHPMNSGGAARIAFGQYPSWIVGEYHDQEALIQDAPITVYRDPRRLYKRYGPTFDGLFGIHQHWGYNYPRDDLGRSSAGCLVGRTTQGHVEFMRLVKSDARYRRDRSFRFPTAVMPASAVV